jgi:hypothetical protein
MPLTDSQIEAFSRLGGYISQRTSNPAEPDSSSGSARDEYSYVYQQSINDLLSEEKASLQQDREERKSYASGIFQAMLISFVLTLLVIVAVGSEKLVISDSVLLAMISFNSLGLIGLFLCVTHYLFQKK